ncbi:MAG TPA: GNAT family protein [Candidatus Limiplasma sp.]|nr:GNAT family protein [Candidatus Limiplasma sp.]
MMQGKLVTLSPLEQEDLEPLRQWRNNPEFRKYFREYREINKDMQLKWYQQKVLGDPSTMMFGIHDAASGELLGCCGLCYINWVHRNADLSLYIGWQNAYIDTEGYAEESCRLLFTYGFQELGLEKIWTEIYEFDEPKYQLYQKLGFQQDGLLRKQYLYNGKYWDSRMLSLLREEFIKD